MEDVLNMNSSSQIASGCRKVTQNYQRFQSKPEHNKKRGNKFEQKTKPN